MNIEMCADVLSFLLGGRLNFGPLDMELFHLHSGGVGDVFFVKVLGRSNVLHRRIRVACGWPVQNLGRRREIVVCLSVRLRRMGSRFCRCGTCIVDPLLFF